MLYRKWRKLLSAVLLCMALLLAVCTPPALAGEKMETVRIGYFKSEKYGYLGADGDMRGYDVHLSKIIGMYGGFRAEMLGYNSVTEMENALRLGDVDVLIDFLRTEQREREFIFTDSPIMEEQVSLYARSAADALAINSITETENLRIGCVSNSGFLEYFLDYCGERGVTPQLVYFDNEAEMRAAMDQGETDACLTGSAVPPGYWLIVSTVSLTSYMMLRREDTALRIRIDGAIRQLNTDHPNYISNLYHQYVVSRETELAPLTAQERSYLTAHRELSVALVRSADPFVFEDADGHLGGIIPNYYRAMGEKLGVTFRFVLYDGTRDAVDAVSRGEVEILGHYYGDIILAEKDGLYDTIEYGDTNCARLTRSGFSGRVRSAAVTDRTVHLLIDQLEPDLRLEICPNIESCYRTLRNGKVDAVIGSMTAVTWLINQHTLRGVNLSVLPDVTLGVRGAVSQENLVLLSVLNKAISVSNTALNQAILENAVSGSTSLRTALENLPVGFSAAVVAVLLLLILLLIVTLLRLRHTSREREAMLNQAIDVDGLTGAGSRRYGTVLMNRDLLLFRRYGNGPMLAMLDVDHFKGKNDTYGHEYGDYVLQKVVEILRGTLRQSDEVIRWGGDEFILICPQMTCDGAEHTLEKVVQAINSADFRLNGRGEQITISVGASFFRQGDADIVDVLRRCDCALYQAKSVRNTYRVFSGLSAPEQTDQAAKARA